MTIKEYLDNSPFEEVLLLKSFSYDSAFIGVSNDGRAIYDFDEMVNWLKTYNGWSTDEAEQWIESNTLKSLPYYGDKAPIIMYRCEVDA